MNIINDEFHKDYNAIEYSSYLEEMKMDMLNEDRYLSIEQALIITKTYQENENLPKNLKRAKALYHSLTEINIQIDPREKIVGNRTTGVRSGVVFPEGGISWLDQEIETLETRIQDNFIVKKEDIKIFREEIMPYWKNKTLEEAVEAEIGEVDSVIKKVAKINQKDHAQGHINADFKTWVTIGPSGILKKAKAKKETCREEEKSFYESVIIAYEGTLLFIKRYATLAREMALEDQEHRANLLNVAKSCENIANGRIDTFQEAIQATWFLITILQMESNASSFSPGRFDQYLYPFYLNDRKKGVSNQELYDLICHFWLKCNQIVYMRNTEGARYFAGFPIGFNVALSGKNRQGKDMTNELSYLCLQAQAFLAVPQPNLSVRLHHNTPYQFLMESAKVIGRGSGMPQVFNDEKIIPALIEKGISEEDAYNYCIVGCVEISPSGNFLGWSDAGMFNLVKALEVTLNNGRCLITNQQIGKDLGNLTTYATMEELEDAFGEQIRYLLNQMIPCLEAVDRLHSEYLPSPFLSGVVDACLDKGKDVTAGGAKYNYTGIPLIQVANIADSLAALKKLVFDENRISKEEMLNQLKHNFENEIIRLTALNKAPKYGNDVAWVDAYGQKWVKFFADELTKYRNIRGGIYQASLYSVSAHVPMGLNTGATPDGRRAQEPLADGGMSAVYGRDISGPTALLNSVSHIDASLGSNGTLLNMKFLPAVFKDEYSIDKFISILKTIVNLGIMHTQFNVVNKDDLLKAKANPEAYKSMTIRVAGYTAYFTELAPDLQDEIIARTTYMV